MLVAIPGISIIGDWYNVHNHIIHIQERIILYNNYYAQTFFFRVHIPSQFQYQVLQFHYIHEVAMFT